MDKTAIKKYAIWARNELIARITQKAMQYGVTEQGCESANADTINGVVLTATEKQQRATLLERIKEKGFKNVIEEVAYTWFNRFCALRFMEVNNYLPSKERVFTNEANEFRPQILDDALDLDFAGIDLELVIAYKQAEETEKLYKYLLIWQCNALNDVLPDMFQKLEDYTELLLPDNLLRKGSVIERMIADIPEEDWQDAVQIIGWLYQYYNTEPKDTVFANLKKNIKISKENIPAATQLFTPDWIVRYMVENSLGRLWVEGHPETELEKDWKYFLPEAEQEDSVKVELAKIRAEYAKLEPENLLFIDPCMGSGHIIAYAFDVLMQIYTSYGYNKVDAVRSIVEHNLWGLDIDERASQLAYFTVMMTACKYDKQFLKKHTQPKVYAIVESNSIDRNLLNCFGAAQDEVNRNNALNEIQGLLDDMMDAKEYGSIISVRPWNWNLLREFAEEFDVGQNLFAAAEVEDTQKMLLRLIDVGQALAQKYHVVVTNPPYMTISNGDSKLSEYVKIKFPDSKSDLFAVFMECIGKMLTKNGMQAMITQHSWMFLSSFEKLRIKLLMKDTVNMAHLGARAFEEIGGEVVQTTSFVLRNSHLPKYKVTYCRLIDPTTQQGKEDMFLAGENRFTTTQDNFLKIPGSPIAYWISSKVFNTFKNDKLSAYGSTNNGFTTGNNDLFLRYWYEPVYTEICFDAKNVEDSVKSHKRWFPYNKGGAFRKWYGNNEFVINWFDDGSDIKTYGHLVPRSMKYQFRASISWSKISSSCCSFKIKEQGTMFDVAGLSLFLNDVNKQNYVLGILNSVYGKKCLEVLSPTLNYETGHISSIPIKESETDKDAINILVNNCIGVSKSDWDSSETSWDFRRHPLVPSAYDKAEQEASQFAHSRMEKFGRLSWHYDKWVEVCERRFNKLKANEEELNRIFIDIYGLQDELTSEVADKDVTVRRIFDTKEEIPEEMRGGNYAQTKQDVIKSLISYAVGCMFGRYSLDVGGLAYAGGDWNSKKYKSFPADADGILPICDDAYFQDDIVGLFIKFVETVYGQDTLEENLRFVADALGGRGSSREVIRSYFLNDFYKDHCKTYQKRPIYWLFDSGKKNGFKALVYMHRYQKDTMARLRTDYVHERQSRYRDELETLDRTIAKASASEQVKLKKQRQKYQDQADELHAYEEKIHHWADKMMEIDLDDGVKHNYAIFQDVLAKIK